MRVSRWEDRLVEFIDAHLFVPFAWGTNDCVTFAAKWIEVCTGEKVFEPEHDDVHTAAAELAKRGGIAQAIRDVLGDPLPNPLAAQRGDIGLVEIEGRQSAVVVIGADAVGPGEGGLHKAPITSLVMAWRV